VKQSPAHSKSAGNKSRIALREYPDVQPADLLFNRGRAGRVDIVVHAQPSRFSSSVSHCRPVLLRQVIAPGVHSLARFRRQLEHLCVMADAPKMRQCLFAIETGGNREVALRDNGDVRGMEDWRVLERFVFTFRRRQQHEHAHLRPVVNRGTTRFPTFSMISRSNPSKSTG